MLEIRKLQVDYNGTNVLRDIDLLLEDGDALAVVGESGAGKTTLGLSLVGLVEGTCRGEIIYRGDNILDRPETERRRLRGKNLAMVFQNVDNALHPCYQAVRQVAESILVHQGMKESEAEAHSYQLLARTGIDKETADCFPHQLSGGQKQRVLLAMAMANDPDVLILDEPTASLDVLTRQEIIRLIREITADKIVLTITHDLSTAAQLSEKLAVLYSGQIVEMGRTEELLKQPRHPYTRGLLRSYPHMNSTKDLQGIPGRMELGVSGCKFHPRCTQKIEVCRQSPPQLQEIEGRRLACHRGGIVPALEVRRLRKRFGSLEAVSQVQFTLYEGETLALIGQSGSGKTTLAKAVMGLLKADEEEVYLEGERISLRDRGFYQRIQMVFQNPTESISHRMNVWQALIEPLEINQSVVADQEREAKVKRTLEEVELPSDNGFLSRYPHHMSGGEIQRLAIARALMLDPKVLIADEPTSALDASLQAKVIKLLLNLQERRGLALLLITHDIALAKKVSDRFAVMLEGSLVEEGASFEVIGSPEHPYTKKLVDSCYSESI